MTTKSLEQFFSDWVRSRQPLVLATVYETQGSTYSKAGAQMLITADGRFRGMLSGGCLEGDLAERAKIVAESGEPQSVTYDLAANDGELWGLGVGCDGLMRIFLQPLSIDTNYEPFASIAKGLQGDIDQLIATVIDSDVSEMKLGSTMVVVNEKIVFNDVASELVAEFDKIIASSSRRKNPRLETLSGAAGNVTVLCRQLAPPPAVLILGAGLDAEPVVRFGLEMGWRITLQDHRPAYLDSGNFSGVEHVSCVPAGSLAETIDLDRFAAAIVMSHHLTSDREYLLQLADSVIPFVGLLGPVNRRQKLLREIGDRAANIEDRLQGPAGIDLGGRGPAAIALSIVAGVHQAMLRPE